MCSNNCSGYFWPTTTGTNFTNNRTNISEQIPTTNSDSEYAYVILTAVTSGLSIIGGATICILYIGFRDMRTPSRNLLFFLALSDALLAFGNLLGVIWYLYSDSKVIHKNQGYCAFQSAMTIYFSCTSFFWTVTMALSLFHAVVLKNASFAASYIKLFHLLAWIPPGIIVIVALGMGVLGTDTSLEQASWCWIDPRTKHVLVWQLVTGKFWEILSYVTVVVLYATIKVLLRKQELKKKSMIGPGTRRSRRDVIAEANRRLTFVPLVFIVCRIWGTLRFLLGNFAVDHINEPYVTWINPLQGIGDSAQGFANCVLYCLSTEKIRHRLARVICPGRLGPEQASGNEVYSKYSKRTRVGVAEKTSEAFTDVHQFVNDQSTSVVERNIAQTVNVSETNTDQSVIVDETNINQSTTLATCHVENSTQIDRAGETNTDDKDYSEQSPAMKEPHVLNNNTVNNTTEKHVIEDIFCVTKTMTV